MTLKSYHDRKNYVNDYKLLLVEARQNNLTLHNTNNIELFHLLEIILDRSIPKNEAKKRAIQYSEKHKADKSVIMTIAGATNSKINYNVLEKGESGRYFAKQHFVEEPHDFIFCVPILW